MCGKNKAEYYELMKYFAKKSGQKRHAAAIKKARESAQLLLNLEAARAATICEMAATSCPGCCVENCAQRQ